MPGLECGECYKMYSLGGFQYVRDCFVDGTYKLPIQSNMCTCAD